MKVKKTFEDSFMKKYFLKEPLIIFSILLLLLSIAFYDIFFLGKTFKAATATSQAMSYGVYGQKDNRPKFIPVNGTDASILEEPIYEFIKQSLRAGILPLWNPHQGCGFPLIGMLETGIFFPLNLILYLLPQLYSWDILIISRFLLGGFFTYCFMRTLKFPKIPAFVSAVTFMLSGPMVLLQYWFANVDILAPLLLLFLERLVQKPKIQNICLVAIVVSLTFFAGHPEHILFVNTLGFLFFCFRILSLKKSIHYKKSALYLGISYLVGIGLAAVVLLPFLYNLFSEFWSPHPPLVGLTTGEVKNRIITIALPYFFQKESLTYDFTFAGWWGGYVGLLPLALAFASLLNKQKRGRNYFFAVLAFLIIAKSYSVPIVNWIGYLPIFNLCRFYIHTTHLFAFSIAILAGMGTRSILLNKNVFKKSLSFSLSMAGIIVLYLFYFRESEHFLISAQASLFALAILFAFQLLLFLKDKEIFKKKYVAALLVLIVFSELLFYIPRERAKRFDSFPQVPYIELIKNSPEYARAYGIFWAFYPNTATAYQVDDLGIFFSLLPKRYVQFINHLVVENHFKNGLQSPSLRTVPLFKAENFLDLLNLQYVISPGPGIILPLSFRRAILKANSNNSLIYSHEVNIHKRPHTLPRVFITHHVIEELDDNLVFEKLRGISDLGETITIKAHLPVSLKNQLTTVPLNSSSEAHITKYTPNEVIIDANLEQAGFLVISDTFHPDWKAFVDEKPTNIYETDYLMRSVFLPAGFHEIKFVFKPFSFYLGAFISALFLSLIIALLVFKKINIRLS